MKKRKVIYIISLAIMISAAAGVLNMKVSIQQGIDGNLRRIEMPLYAKWIGFLARHYEYARLAREITASCRTDEEKALAILKWTNKNIRQEIPKGFSVVDDHILNIIIRGYGSEDQSQDVFTTLCSYSRLTAFWMRIESNDRNVRYPISFVKLDGKWRVFDSYRGIYLKNREGAIASIEDMIQDRSIIENAKVDNISYNGIPYKEFLYNIKPIGPRGTLRPDKQKPMRRILFAIKKMIGLEAEEKDE